LIMIYCIYSCFGSTSSNYINFFPIISSLCGNPLKILIITIPCVLCLYHKYRTLLCCMICCKIVHACCWWLWTIRCIISRLLEIMSSFWSFASSKSSSSMSSSSESSFFSLIFCKQCIILCYLTILWWCYKLLHIIILIHMFSCH